MSFWYTPAKERLANGEFDWDAGDFRALLCMTNTTAGSDQDAGSITAISVLDEYDGTGYSRAELAGEAVVREDMYNRAKLSANSPISFGTVVAAGTRLAAGVIVYEYIDGTPGNDKPVAWIDTGGFPIGGASGPFTVGVHPDGLLQVI